VKKRQGYGDCGSRLSDRKSDGHCETRTSYNGEGDKTSSLFSQTFVRRKHDGSDLRTEFKPKRGDWRNILMVRLRFVGVSSNRYTPNTVYYVVVIVV